MSTEKKLIIFKPCTTSLVLDFCLATNGWLQLDILSHSKVYVCVTERENQKFYFSKSKETVSYQIRISEEQHLYGWKQKTFCVLWNTASVRSCIMLYQYIKFYKSSITRREFQFDNTAIIWISIFRHFVFLRICLLT